MPEFDADWEKGIFPMGQVPVLQANGYRFAQVLISTSAAPHEQVADLASAVQGHRALHRAQVQLAGRQ